MTVHQARDYQIELKAGIYAVWRSGKRNALAVSPTGSGKTFTFADIISELNVPTCAIAHRTELVTQISLALAREGVRHRIIGQPQVARDASAAHMEELRCDFVHPRAGVAVASVDTLVRMNDDDPWFKQVGLWVGDEAHHFLKLNKWGRACAMFPNAWGLGVTATPLRADGKGLGDWNDGVFHELVRGPTMRQLITAGHLTDYRVINLPGDIQVSEEWITASGEYSPPKLSAARAESHITGDVVEHYMTYAAGKRGVTFDVDIRSATETANAFKAKGIKAEVVSSHTPDDMRRAIVRRFRNGDLLQLVNVDLFGEGFDLPAIEVVSMARPTNSYGLFVQQFGRALRPLEGKGKAIIIDHVRNIKRHNLPDAPREWSLERRERRSRSAASDAIPLKTCLNPHKDPVIGSDPPEWTGPRCASEFEAYRKTCPYCGFRILPTNRSAPEFVDGDLTELDPAVLAKMRGEVARIDYAPTFPHGMPAAARDAVVRRHYDRQGAQVHLRKILNLWLGWQNALGRDDGEGYSRFYFQFGVDFLTAHTYGEKDALTLRERVQAELDKYRVVDKTAQPQDQRTAA